MGCVATADVLLLDESEIIAWQWARGSSRIINVVEIAYDWNTAQAKDAFGTRARYTQGTLTSPGTSLGKYGQRAPLVIESRGISSSYGGAALADARAREVTRRFAEPPMMLQLHCLYRTHTLEPGDLVKVTHARIPNPLTGLRGLDREHFEVIDLRPFFGAEGKVVLTLLWTGAVYIADAPTSSGAIATPAASEPVAFDDLTVALGPEVAGFAYYHAATFGASTPRYSYREAVPADLLSYVVASGDRLEYEIAFSAGSVDTRGGLDLAVQERASTLQAGSGSTTAVLDTGASAVDDTYNTMYIEIPSTGEIKAITDYVGSTRTATIASAWTTTPGAVAYVIRRVLRNESGVVDAENGLGASPATQLGSRALDQWYHRTIPLPAAWVGKALDAAATGLDNDAVGAVAMRIANARITSAAGGQQVSIARRGYAAQAVWAYGGESNVSAVTIAQDAGGGAVPSSGIQLLAITRGGLGRAAGPFAHNSSTETVKATFSALAHKSASTDTIRLWMIADLYLSDQGSSTGTATVRIRRGTTTSGEVLAEYTITRPASKAGVQPVTHRWVDMGVDIDAAVGDVDYCFTMQRNSGDFSNEASDVRVMALVRSA